MFVRSLASAFGIPAIAMLFAGSAWAQFGSSPIPVPQPQGGPIVSPEGRILSGADKSPWSGNFEFGINGNLGNTDVLKLRTGGDLKYDSPDNVLLVNGWYSQARQNNSFLEHKALLTVRDEIPINEVLSYFGQGQLEYDEFRAIDWRLALHAGMSWTAIKSESTLLKFRLGAGASREVGGPKDEWIPEGLAGLDWEQSITKSTKFVGSVDYFPDIQDWSRFRVRARGALEFMLDPELNMCLRLGAVNRFDSQPGTSRKNDLDYYATLLFKF
jgi:Protein of unknown function, DUF481